MKGCLRNADLKEKKKKLNFSKYKQLSSGKLKEKILLLVQFFQLPAHVTATQASDICIRRHVGKQRARFALKKGNFHIRNIWCMQAQPENRDASRVCFAVCWYWPKVCLAGKKVPPDFIAPYPSKFAIELREK